MKNYTVELPVIYLKNYKEVTEGEEKGIEIEKIEETKITSFILPEDIYVRINPSSEDRTTVHFNDLESYVVEADYETVMAIFKREMK